MRVVAVRFHALPLAFLKDAARREEVSLAQYLRDSAWAMTTRPSSPAFRQWVALVKVVRVLGWEAVHAAYLDALDAKRSEVPE